MDSEVLVKVDGVQKKFCRSLKKSLWYGLKDMLAEIGGGGRHGTLRPGEFWAVNNVSFELRRGECLGLIGHNGAGKTSLLKMLNGLNKPDLGRIEMHGRIGALIALGAGFNPILTGRENIFVNGAVLGLRKKEIEAKLEEIIDFAEIGDFIDSPVQSYSSGMQVRLGFAIASSLQADILLLDEVLAVGDMGFQAKCFNRLAEMRRNGTSYILVSHSMHHITRFCDTVLYLRKGNVAYLGPTERGVEMFVKEMGMGASESSDKVAPLEEAGSRSIVFQEVSFKTPAGEPVKEIEAGDPVDIVVRYHSRNGPVLNPILEFGLRDPEGVAWFHGSSKMAGVPLGEFKEFGTLTISLPSLPANNQNLTLSLALWDDKQQELIYWCRGAKIWVNGHPSSTGRVQIGYSWLHEKGLSQGGTPQ